MYTKKQLEYLRQCEKGLVWDWLEQPEEDCVLRYLWDEGLIEPRCDIADKMFKTTQKGQCVLEDLDKIKQQREKAEQDKQAEKKAEAIKRKKDVAKEICRDLLVPLLRKLIGWIH